MLNVKNTKKISVENFKDWENIWRDGYEQCLEDFKELEKRQIKLNPTPKNN